MHDDYRINKEQTNYLLSEWTTCIIDFGPLSMTVGGCRLLPNEMAAVGVGISFRVTLQRILNYLLHRSASLLLREITRELFAILWGNLRIFCPLAVEKMR